MQQAIVWDNAINEVQSTNTMEPLFSRVKVRQLFLVGLFGQYNAHLSPRSSDALGSRAHTEELHTLVNSLLSSEYADTEQIINASLA